MLQRQARIALERNRIAKAFFDPGTRMLNCRKALNPSTSRISSPNRYEEGTELLLPYNKGFAPILAHGLTPTHYISAS